MESDWSQRALLADGVRDLQLVCGDELGQLLQTLNEADLPAELIAVENRVKGHR